MRKKVVASYQNKPFKRVSSGWWICGGTSRIVPIDRDTVSDGEYTGVAKTEFLRLLESLLAGPHANLTRNDIKRVEDFVTQFGFYADDLTPSNSEQLGSRLLVVTCVLESNRLFQLWCDSVDKQRLIDTLSSIAVVTPFPLPMHPNRFKKRLEAACNVPGFWFDPLAVPPSSWFPPHFQNKLDPNHAPLSDVLNHFQEKSLTQTIKTATEHQLKLVVQHLHLCMTPTVAAAFAFRVGEIYGFKGNQNEVAFFTQLFDTQTMTPRELVWGAITLFDTLKIIGIDQRRAFANGIAKGIHAYDPTYQFKGVELKLLDEISFFDRALWAKSKKISVSDYLDRSMFSLFDSYKIVATDEKETLVPCMSEEMTDWTQLAQTIIRASNQSVWPNSIQTLVKEKKSKEIIIKAMKDEAGPFSNDLSDLGLLVYPLVSRARVRIETIGLVLRDLQSDQPETARQLSLLQRICRLEPSDTQRRFNSGTELRQWLASGGDPEEGWRACIAAKKSDIALGNYQGLSDDLASAWAQWASELLTNPLMARHIRGYHYITKIEGETTPSRPTPIEQRTWFSRMLFPKGLDIPAPCWPLIASTVLKLAMAAPKDQFPFLWKDEITWIPLMVKTMPDQLTSILKQHDPALIDTPTLIKMLPQKLDCMSEEDSVNAKMAFLNRLNDRAYQMALATFYETPDDIAFLRHLAGKDSERVFQSIPLRVNQQKMQRLFGWYSPMAQRFDREMEPVKAHMDDSTNEIKANIDALVMPTIMAIFPGLHDAIHTDSKEKIMAVLLEEFHNFPLERGVNDPYQSRLDIWGEHGAKIITTTTHRCVASGLKGNTPWRVRKALDSFNWEWDGNQDVVVSFVRAIAESIEGVTPNAKNTLKSLLTTLPLYGSDLENALLRRLELDGHTREFRTRFVKTEDAKRLYRIELSRLIRSEHDFFVALGIWPKEKDSYSPLEFILAVNAAKEMGSSASRIPLPRDFYPAFSSLTPGAGWALRRQYGLNDSSDSF